MSLVQTTAPTVEPISLADVKLHCRIIDSSEDTLLSLMIAAARRYAESYTNRSFITQKWRMVLDSFCDENTGQVIQLERGTVQSVDSITYTAMDGTTQTAATSVWAAEIVGNPARVFPRFGQTWPIPLPQIGAVVVDYTAGYGPLASDVPEGIRHWMLMRVATLYENREEVAMLMRGTIQALPFVDSLLDPYTVVTA